MNIHAIENRVLELMRSGKASPIKGWSAREIADRITFEWRDDKAGVYAFAHIAHIHSTPLKKNNI